MSDSTSNKLCVLVVDDQSHFREAVAFEFEMLGWNPITAENGKDAFEKFQKHKNIDLIISDIRMPEWDGPKLLSELRKIAPLSPPFIFMTGFADLTIESAFDLGADAFLGKPLNPEHLTTVLEKLSKKTVDRWTSRAKETPGTVAVSISSKTWGDNAHHTSFALGRGGVFVSKELAPQLCDLSVGAALKFDIQVDDKKLPELKGLGHIVWMDADGGNGYTAGCGIEFDMLEPSCVGNFVSFVEQASLISFIPRKQTK